MTAAQTLPLTFTDTKLCGYALFYSASGTGAGTGNGVGSFFSVTSTAEIVYYSLDIN